jgi:hypothetical protein
MYITHTYKVRRGEQRLYAVGDRQGVIQAVRNTFLNHDMPIHKEKEQIVYHYPGGWLDRAGSAVGRFSSASGSPEESDCFSIKFDATNNPQVTMLLVNLYHKTGWFRDKKVQERIKRFYDGLAHEFGLFQIPLIEADDWPEVVRLHPEIACSPVWKTTVEIRSVSR